ncbi:hypothetical protein WOLCODRAFT_159151 [Wolfiporia cocos MD-104 SS10]|uniref:Uncharacterized protein n=1 Tax=Wolfiporia cocos (strain MD-104) TaxID=742152 RepID=A0A2H3JDB1_WOLCO|nr:hypothetical protein WOLCODRAFT_159151 [Wolfiporia cocos MD-104 SS10]
MPALLVSSALVWDLRRSPSLRTPQQGWSHRHNNRDDRDLRRDELEIPPLSPPPRPSLVATPALRLIKQRCPDPTTSRIGRHPQPSDLDTATLCVSPPSLLHHLFAYIAKTVGPTMPPGSSLGRRPFLTDKLGLTAHHVTYNDEPP